MLAEDIQIGETVYYLLPRAPSNGRPTDQYLEATVLSASPKWVRVKPEHSLASRNVLARNLVRQPPEGAVIR
jgi:hypothetical protein